MRKIKYKMRGKICVTPCPHGMRLLLDKRIIARVGSCGCDGCEFSAANDGSVVTCSYERQECAMCGDVDAELRDGICEDCERHAAICDACGAIYNDRTGGEGMCHECFGASQARHRDDLKRHERAHMPGRI